MGDLELICVYITGICVLLIVDSIVGSLKGKQVN